MYWWMHTVTILPIVQILQAQKERWWKNNESYLNFLPENLHTRDNELFEGDMKLIPGQTRGAVGNRQWPGGTLVYDIDYSLSKLVVLFILSRYEKPIKMSNFNLSKCIFS